MLRLQYSRQLTRLFRKFKTNTVNSVLAIIDNYNNDYGYTRGIRRKTIRQTGFSADIEHYLNWAVENQIIDPSNKIVIRNINNAYKKGVRDSSRQLKQYPDIYVGEGLTTLDVEAMMEIKDINFNLIKGCTDNMKSAIQYSATQGILNGWGTNKIAYEIRRNVHGNTNMGIVRARMIARTEVINAYNVAAKNRYKQAGLTEKDMIWITSFDERTCPICAGYDGMSISKTGEIPPAHPNSYDKDTEVYTKNGWRYVKDINIGDKCLSLIPNTFNLEYQPVIETYKHLAEEMILFNNRVFNLMVTPDHNMFYQTDWNSKYNKDRWQFVKAIDLLNKKSGVFYRSSKWIGENKDKYRLGTKIISPELYAQFMAWFLSEGSSLHSRNIISIAQDKNYNYDNWLYIQELLEDIGFDFSSGKTSFQIHDKELFKQLKIFGKSYQKYIPDDIKSMDKDCLRLFLDVYCLGDGHRKKNKKWKNGNFRDSLVYTTSSKQMADDLGELIIKVGHRPSFNLQKMKGKIISFRNGDYKINHDIWIVSECYSQRATIARLDIDIVDYNDFAYCIDIKDNHTLLVRRNGKVSWCGNCRCSIAPNPRSILKK